MKRKQPRAKRLRLVASTNQVERIAASLAFVELDYTAKETWRNKARRLIEHLQLTEVGNG